MANFFVDSTTGSDGDDGSTMDLAFATLQYALVSASKSPGDRIWVRRIHTEAGGLWQPNDDGSAADFIHSIGWPRPADASITEADWTKGNTEVDTIVGLSIDREQHLGRYITGPDGFRYLITLITDSDTFTIDREYAGATVTATDGACTIHADEDWADDMGTEYSFDDSEWAIQEANWDADPDDLPLIDLSGGLYYLYITGDLFFRFANLDFIGGTSYGIFRQIGSPLFIEGCLLQVPGGTHAVWGSGSIIAINRCIGVGAPGGANRIFAQAGGVAFFSNSAFYGFGDLGFYPTGSVLYLDNVNVGVEVANGDYDLWPYNGAIIYGKDVKLGGTNGIIFQQNQPNPPTSIENYGKVLGAHWTSFGPGTAIKLDVVSGSGDPYKRPDGANSVIEILFDDTGVFHKNPLPPFTPLIFEHEFEATTDTKNYRYYVNAEEAVAADELWIEVEYVSAYDDASEYVNSKVASIESISQQADNEDWTQYMEVTGIAPATDSKVRIKCYCRYYHATAKIYIDPLVVIS
jgi:hypothetical protein